MNALLQEAIKSYHPDFPAEELEAGLAYFEQRSFKAKEKVLEIGNPAEHLLFAKSAISRCYYLNQEGEEQTLWMKPEKTFITEYKSFVSQEPSNFALQFYEDTEACIISRSKLMELYAQYNSWALFGLKLTESLHVILIDVFVNLLANDATQNYRYIEYAFPRFLQVAPLKDIASMLNISPISLSRIRAGNQTKK